jgi:hypothetical protein
MVLSRLELLIHSFLPSQCISNPSRFGKIVPSCSLIHVYLRLDFCSGLLFFEEVIDPTCLLGSPLKILVPLFLWSLSNVAEQDCNPKPSAVVPARVYKTVLMRRNQDSKNLKSNLCLGSLFMWESGECFVCGAIGKLVAHCQHLGDTVVYWHFPCSICRFLFPESHM